MPGKRLAVMIHKAGTTSVFPLSVEEAREFSKALFGMAEMAEPASAAGVKEWCAEAPA